MMQIKHFYDEATHTLSYLVIDETSKQCAIIDSVLNYDPKSGRTSTHSADLLLAEIQQQGLQVQWILETHAHADHLSASSYLTKKLSNAPIAIGGKISQVQTVFAKVFNLNDNFKTDGSQFDTLFEDGQQFNIGNIQVMVMATPGHTPACVSYYIEDGQSKAVFVGDTLFAPDYGTARCDFPGGDAHELYQSIQKLYALPDDTTLYLCHDYAPANNSFRDLVWRSTVLEQKQKNIHINSKTTADEFVTLRQAKDKTLDMPVLLLPSIQVNIRAGQLPSEEDNGVSYLKIPLNEL